MIQMSHEPVLGSHRIEPRTDVHATCVLHLPTPMLRDIERSAARLDRDLSYCLRMAWSIGCIEVSSPEMLELARASRMMSGRKRPLVVSLPLSTWLHVTTEAERLDRSRSWVIQRAWLAARGRIVNAMR
jgi:uncharacterized small protein (TIGR04563 family)